MASYLDDGLIIGGVDFVSDVKPREKTKSGDGGEADSDGIDVPLRCHIHLEDQKESRKK